MVCWCGQPNLNRRFWVVNRIVRAVGIESPLMVQSRAGRSWSARPLGFEMVRVLLSMYVVESKYGRVWFPELNC